MTTTFRSVTTKRNAAGGMNRVKAWASIVRFSGEGACAEIASKPKAVVATILVAMLAAFGLCVFRPATARAQPVEWKQLQVTARFGHAMAYDSARGVTVLFGGVAAGTANGETWEWNGTSWTQKALSGPSPSPRYYHMMAYDAARGVTVLFGGNTGTGPGGAIGETWEWNGTAWTQRNIGGLAPSPRYNYAMAFDSARSVTVLFGGYNSSGANGETWEWNGTAWIQRMVLGPSPREFPVMAYDSARSVTVLFGGETSPSVYNGETWEWNGTVWIQRPESGPAPRSGHAMAYDAAHGVTVLIGGWTNPGITNGETWEWNGTAWTQRAISGPSARTYHAMAYDAARGVTVLFGGYPSEFNTTNAETWEWNGTGGGTWTQQTTNGPSPRAYHAMAYDAAPGRQETVLFGGWLGGSSYNYSNETWVWSGTAWFPKLVVGPSPSPRSHHAMAYDSDRRVTVLFGGGTGPSTYSRETWEWSGTAWNLMSTTGPSPRDAVGLAYDAARRETVLFGGSGPDNDETWVWNGTSWIRRNPANRPLPRWGHAMAYDTQRGVTVLFGGYTYNGSIVYGDIWEWNGIGWTQMMPVGPVPSPRLNHAMVYDAARGKTVLFGGESTNGGVVNGETWEWNGTVWTQQPIVGPSPRNLHAMAYDIARSQTVLFGGSPTIGTVNGETWGLRATCTVASFIAQPSPTATCPTGPAAFAVTVAGVGPFTYQWQYRSGPNNPDALGWMDLVDDRNPPIGPFRLNVINDSARTRLLVVDHDPTPWPDPIDVNNPMDDHIPYLFRCIVTNTCGPNTSDEASLTIASVCIADVDDGSGHGTPDCGVTIEDLLYYLLIFDTGLLAADVDDGSFTGTRDGGVTIEDLLYFLARFDAGC